MIPYARGRVRCREKKSVLEEIKGLVAAGYKEFVLTGIHISSYGMEELLFLIQEIDMIEGVERIRLGSLEPRIITEDFTKELSALTHLCPHFHLSLQSGCDSVLKRMNRHYTTEEYLKGVWLLRKYFDNPAITTDVIVGFSFNFSCNQLIFQHFILRLTSHFHILFCVSNPIFFSREDPFFFQ